MTGKVTPRVMELRAMMGTAGSSSRDKMLLGKALLDEIDNARDMDDVRRVMKALVENLLMKS